MRPEEGSLLDYIYGGVNHSIYGNGGPACVNYIGVQQRLVESILLVPIFVLQTIWAASKIPKLTHTLKLTCTAHKELTDTCHQRPIRRYIPTLRRAILLFYACIFGIEIGYKLSSRTVIYLLNPCHLVTAFQLVGLVYDPRGGDKQPSWKWTLAFRFHMYAMAGGTLAMLFPILNTRKIAWQRWTYWAQHWMIVLTPAYLTGINSSFYMEPIDDIYTPTFTMGLLLLYHYLPLQLLGLATEVNLNNIICPAVSDPFKCRYWRLICVCHQSLWVPLHSKIYIWIVAKVHSMTVVYYTQCIRETPDDQNNLADIIENDKRMQISSTNIGYENVTSIEPLGDNNAIYMLRQVSLKEKNN